MTLAAEALMAVLILLPLAGAALAFAKPRAASIFTIFVAAGLLSSSIALAIHIADESSIFEHRVGGWTAPIGIHLRADGLSAWLILITAVVGAGVTFYARSYFSPRTTSDLASHRRARFFWPLWLFLWSALNALFLSADIFNLYVTLELLGFSAIALVGLAGSRAAIGAALNYLFVSLSGSLLFLLGVALTYAAHSTVDLSLLATQVRVDSPNGLAFGLMNAGLLMKAAIFPLHTWLPAAHANAVSPVSALLSALVVKASFFILLRLWFEAFAVFAVPAATLCLGVFGVLAILWGSCQALVQTRLKRLIAYSTVAQLGYLLLIFPLARGSDSGASAWFGALIFLTAHALAKTAAFLAAGNIMHAAGHDRLRDFGGLAGTLPLSITAFSLAGVSLIGLPPTGGFAGKWLLLQASLVQGQWVWALAILLGSLLAAAYTLRVLAHAFANDPGPRSPRPVAKALEWTALALALLACGLGLVAGWPVELLNIGKPEGGVAP